VGQFDVRDLMVRLHQYPCETSCGEYGYGGVPIMLACSASHPRLIAIEAMESDELEQLKQHLILALSALATRENTLRFPNGPPPPPATPTPPDDTEP
jgi:hypothetical protein